MRKLEIQGVATELELGRGTVARPRLAHIMTHIKRVLTFGSPTSTLHIITALIPDGVTKVLFNHCHKDSFGMWRVPCFLQSRGSRLNERAKSLTSASSAVDSWSGGTDSTRTRSSFGGRGPTRSLPGPTRPGRRCPAQDGGTATRARGPRWPLLLIW